MYPLSRIPSTYPIVTSPLDLNVYPNPPLYSHILPPLNISLFPDPVILITTTTSSFFPLTLPPEKEIAEALNPPIPEGTTFSSLGALPCNESQTRLLASPCQSLYSDPPAENCSRELITLSLVSQSLPTLLENLE